MIWSRLKYFLFLAFLFLPSLFSYAQDVNSSGNWDNQIYIGDKIAGGKNKWKFSGEFQIRLKDNLQQLDNWYLEQVTNYLATKWLEIVPDFRFTVKPDRLEFRPGFGILLKKNTNSWQFINQIKWQIDLDTKGRARNALREVVFVNRKFDNEHFVATALAGFIYRWTGDENFMQYIRFGPGLSYVFDQKHILNVSYMMGVENTTQEWKWSGITMIQLVINITKKYKYKPAYYFDF